MTACVNNEKEIKGGVSGKVLRTVAAGVLAMSMMPAAALAAPTAAEDSEAAPLGIQSADFTSVEFTWSAEPDVTGDYYLPYGTPFYVVSATDIYGNPVPASDYQVIYVADDDGNGELASDDVVYTTAPTGKGAYVAILIEGGLSQDLNKAIVSGTTAYGNSTDADSVSGEVAAAKANNKVQYQVFEILAKSLEGAYFFQDGNVTDKSFKYTGNAMTFGIADANGEKLDTNDYDIVWVGTEPTNSTAIAPGTYTAVLNGKKDYEGSQAKISFTVDKIDLAKDKFTVATLKKAADHRLYFNDETGTAAGDEGTVLEQDTAGVQLFVNGEPLAANVVKMTADGVTGVDGIYRDAAANNADSNKVNVSDASLIGRVSMSVTKGADDKCFVNKDATGYAEVEIVTDLADVKYDGIDMGNYFSIKDTFDLSKGEGFDASLVEATNPAGDKNVAKQVKVYKDGVEVQDFTQPGTYTATVSVPAPKDFSYGAYEVYEFDVVARQLTAEPTSYVSVDGNGLDANQTAKVEYDAEAVEPAIVVKAGTKTLAEGADYQVTYKDFMGNAVESIVEPGTYTGTIDFLGAVYANGATNAGAKVPAQTFTVIVEKAQARSAKADLDVYDMTGETVTPTFTVYSEEDLEGFSVAVDPAATGATYYEMVWADTDGDDVADAWVKKLDKNGVANPIKGSDLKDEGFYVAVVPVPSADPHMQGSVESEVFEIREYAKYEDVDAGAWYANSVYAARDLLYMTGVGGTKLFMPEASISREQVASVLFNMAGQEFQDGIYFPTRFADAANGWAWFAQAVAWADQAGVMTGYAGTDTFGIGDNATREQVAAIFYNYAKAQGKDMTVADVDGTLAKYSDGAQVSEWAKTAVAWAVENGVMGNGATLAPQDNVTRAQMAAMAVNFQPEALK